MKNELKTKVNRYQKPIKSLASKSSEHKVPSSSKDPMVNQRKDDASRPMYLDRYE